MTTKKEQEELNEEQQAGSEAASGEDQAKETAASPEAAAEPEAEEQPEEEAPAEAEAPVAANPAEAPQAETDAPAEAGAAEPEAEEAAAPENPAAAPVEEKPSAGGSGPLRFAPPAEEFDWDADQKGFSGYSQEEREKLENLYAETLRPISKNEIVTGKVVAVTAKDVVLNVGFKSDGLVPLSEFRDMPDLKAGDEVDV
ncbi:MAG TPA: hypothetical protein VD772_05245, partial [Anseongella sp.]|nr:hypothetical protein [Anseongella sp.]